MKFHPGKTLGDVYRRRNKVLREAYKTKKRVIGHIRIPRMKLKRLAD